jgi:hypothetical protein
VQANTSFFLGDSNSQYCDTRYRRLEPHVDPFSDLVFSWAGLAVLGDYEQIHHRHGCNGFVKVEKARKTVFLLSLFPY